MVTKPRSQAVPQSARQPAAHQHEWIVDVTTGRVARRSCAECVRESATEDQRYSLNDALEELLAATNTAPGERETLRPSKTDRPTT